MVKLYSFIALMLLAMGAGAQTTVQIGTGNEIPANTLYSPVYRFTATSTTTGSRSNIVFTAAEMAAAGITSGAVISKVEFNKTNAASFVVPATHQMLMGNTSNSTLATTTTWASILSTHTQVFSSTAFTLPSVAGWVEWTVAPFTYTGGSFEIATETSMTGNGGSDGPFQWQYTSGAADKVVGVSTATGATLNGTVAAYKHRPNIRITFSSGTCTEPAVPGQATANAPLSGVCPGASVSLSLTGNSAGSNQLYKWQSASTQAGTYTDISTEASSPGFTANPAVTTWYRAVVKCGPSGVPQNSAPVEVKVNDALPAGTYTINNTQLTSGANFQSFGDAVSRLNCGVAGSVVFEVAAGQSFSESVELTTQATAAASITFRKAGAGANPKLSKTGTSTGGEYLLKLTGADYITFDGIDLEQTGTSTSDWIEYGIFIANASATNGAHNNTFRNINISLSSGNTAARGVFMDQVTTPTSALGANSNNRFLNLAITNSFNGYYITGAVNAYPDEGTEINTEGGGISKIENLGNATAAASMYAVYASYQTNFKLKNTLVNTLQNGGTSLIYLTYFLSSTVNSAEVSGNTYSNITGGGVITGIYMTSGTSLAVFNNKFFGIRSTTAAASAVRGIDLTATGLAADIYSNIFYNISSSGLTTTTVGAIEVATGLSFNIYNNMISDLRAQGSTSTAGSIKGIAVVGGSTGGVVRIYYNTVLLTEAGTTAGYTSAGIYNSSTVPTLDIRNNLIINKTDVSIGTRAVAFWKTSTTVNLDVNSDNNLYYAGTPGTKNLIYYDGSNSVQLLDAYKQLTGIAPREDNSLTEDVSFLPVTGGIIRVSPTTQSQAESGGKDIAGYSVDFEGTQRGPYPLQGEINGAGVKPDIGADEFDGRTTDISGPLIDFVTLANTSATGNRTLTVTITDASGVQTGTNGPRLYYRKSGSTLYSIDDNPTVSGNQFTFTFTSSAIGGVVAGDVIEYYLAAQDINGYSRTSPFGGTGSTPPGSTAPATPALYRILNNASGTYTVGASGNYPNLTAVAEFLNNSAEITGHTLFELQADYNGAGETFPVQFNQVPANGPGWMVTVRPAPGVTGLLTAGDPATANPLINLNGVDRITFDGRPGGAGSKSEWTFRNTRTAATVGSVFRFINDATNDTLRYLVIEGQPTSTTSGLIHISTSTGNSGNSFNAISSNILSGRTDGSGSKMSNGIYSSGTNAALNGDISILSNHIINSVNNGIFVAATGNGNNWLISGNHVYGDSVSTTTQNGISFASDTSLGVTISNNFIGGNAPNATGLQANNGNTVVSGINITGGVVKVLGNTIANISNTNTGATVRVRGIYNTSAKDSIVISNNSVYNLASFGNVTGLGAGSQVAVGISIWPGDTFYYTTLTGNTVYNVSAENPSAFTTSNMAAGVFLTNFKGIFAGNKVYNIRNNSTGTTAGQPPIAAGIYARFLEDGYVVNNMISLGNGETNNVQYNGVMVNAAGTTGNRHFYYYNTVYVAGSATGDFSSHAFVKGDNTNTSPVQNINLRNNILYMLRTGGGSANYAIASQGTSPGTNWLSNYNVLYNSDNTKAGLWDNTGYDLAGWQTTTSHDANSKATTVNFVNPSIADFHLTLTSAGNQQLAGIPIEGIVLDFDLQNRSASRPYIGADEAAISLPVHIEYFKGVRQGNIHVLSWKGQCTGAQNTFILERSGNGRDFVSIGELMASQNQCNLPFVLTDQAPLAGMNYYRLRIRDEGGRIAYSFVIAIINKETGFEIVSVFPTLTTGTLIANVTTAKSTPLHLTVIDLQGRVVKEARQVVQQGSTMIKLDVSLLTEGSYLLRAVTPGGYNQSFRFIKH